MQLASRAEKAVDNQVALRPFVAADAPGVLAVMRAGWTSDPISSDWFTVRVLLDLNFDPAGFLLAVDGDHIVGIAYGVRARMSTGLPRDGSWIPLLIVSPDHRRRGLATSLLVRTIKYLEDSGAAWADVGGYAPAYVIPGVDESATAGIELLRRSGFEVTERPLSMRRTLKDLHTPDAVSQAEARAVRDGFTFRSCSPGDLPELMEFAVREGAPDWRDVIRDSSLEHHRWDRTQIVRDEAGAMVGFATFASYEGDRTRFGPMAVDRRLRGRLLGAILLYRTLHAMRADGADAAFFLWVTTGSAAERLYRSAGFIPDRQFAVMRMRFQLTTQQP